MALKNMSLLASATLSASGGSALAFAEDGISITNGVHLIVPADTDYQTRRSATVKYRPPTLNAKTGAMGKDKKSICYAQPVILTDGSVVFNTLRIEREVHPSTSAANCTEMNKVGAQMLFDTDTDGFWATGATS